MINKVNAIIMAEEKLAVDNSVIKGSIKILTESAIKLLNEDADTMEFKLILESQDKLPEDFDERRKVLYNAFKNN